MIVSQYREKLINAFSDLHFDEKRHLYTLDGRPIPSVSKQVEGHAEKVDFEKILPFSAAKKSREEGREVSVNELRGRWKDKNKIACDRGHDTHSFLENFTGAETPSSPWEEAGVKFFRDMTQEWDIIFREIRMHSRKYWFAGTDDLVLINRVSGEIITADYKTNEDLWKNYKGRTLLPPFDTMLDMPYNKYQIQLSYYQIMLEDVGFSVTDRWLVYLKPDATYKIYKLYDFTKELREYQVNKRRVA